MTTLLEFAISNEFKFDRASGRFRYTTGAGKGKFAPREAVLSLTRQTIAAQKQDLINIGQSLIDGEIDLKTFQLHSAELLRQIHCGMAVVGRGGIDRMTSSDWLSVARSLKQQYKGSADASRKFGLKWLANEIKQGEVSPATLLMRLGLYAESGKLSFYAMEKRSQQEKGKTQARRILSPSDNHCKDCPRLAQLGWVSLSQLIFPSQKCQCLNNCKCDVEYR